MRDKTFVTLGASNHSRTEREKYDYYATEPRAVELLLEKEKFNNNIWECACGEGHISEVLKNHGYSVHSTDLVDRGYGNVKNFLDVDIKFDGDIITNPPYKHALEFVKKALQVIRHGGKVAMFLKIQFLEGQKRKEFFKTDPPKRVLVASKRLICAKNGEFKKNKSSAVCYAWFIWEKGCQNKPEIEWIN